MGYIAESLNEMSHTDLRAWALSQIGPGLIDDRIAEAEKLIQWVFSPIAPKASLSAAKFALAEKPQKTGRLFASGSAPDLCGSASPHEMSSSSSSVVADGEGGDSVAADPRNDATPDTSAKGVRDDV